MDAWRVAGALALALLVGACGARKPRKSKDGAAPNGAAPVSAPAWVELPNPAAETVDVIAADEAVRAATGDFFPNATDLFTLEQNHRNSAGATGRDERAQHAFWISRASGEAATHRHVHCASARVIQVESTAALDSDARVADQWVLRVVPEASVKGGPRSVELTWYRHIVKYHELAYIGRGKDGIALYQYVRPRPVPEGS